MKDINRLSWEEKKIKMNQMVVKIKVNFDKYKEEVSMLGHAIGYRNGKHFIGVEIAGTVCLYEYTKQEEEEFIFKMAELILTS